MRERGGPAARAAERARPQRGVSTAADLERRGVVLEGGGTRMGGAVTRRAACCTVCAREGRLLARRSWRGIRLRRRIQQSPAPSPRPPEPSGQAPFLAPVAPAVGARRFLPCARRLSLVTAAA